ncbi:O-antigen ligase [Actinomadura hallensis]|uniref:O-antigen ligase n=1 Tax=Actinomadura hallensis TaxID=337895 RepID=A0A543I8E8_9ACTN|nr:O-antigen ligase family protein [Actinomadura hallensis]TQM66760.1 O-antigen ligase [Actinomadura hallensis]
MSDCAPAFAWSETARAMQPSQGLRPSRARAAAPARPGGLGWGTRPAWAARAARAAFRRPSWLVAAVVLSVGVPSGSPVFGPGLQIGPGDVASVALVLAAALLLATGRAWLPRAVLPAFGPMAAAVAVGTMCSTSVESSLPGFVRNVQLFVLVPVAVVALVRDRRDLAIVCSSLIALGLAESGYGIWQSATGNGAAMGEENIRAVGTFGAADVMAMSIVAAIAFLVLTVFALVAPGRGRAALPLALAGLGVLAAGLALALSRGTWLALGAAGVFALVVFDRRIAVKALVCCGVLLLAAPAVAGGSTAVERARSMAGSITSPDRSVQDRYHLWAAAGRMWQDHPVTGVGLKNFPAYRDSYAGIELSSGSDTADPVRGYERQPLLSPHNQYLLFLAEQGVVGLAALAALFGTLLAGLWARRRPRDPFWLASAALMTFLLVNFVYADLGGPTCVLFSVVLGVVACRAFGEPAAGEARP